MPQMSSLGYKRIRLVFLSMLAFLPSFGSFSRLDRSKMKLSWRSNAAWVSLLLLLVFATVCCTGEPGHDSPINPEGWWKEDHPFGYENLFKRLPDGSVVFNNASDPMDELPPLVKFVNYITSRNGSRARRVLVDIRKDLMEEGSRIPMKIQNGYLTQKAPGPSRYTRGMTSPAMIKGLFGVVKAMVGYVKQKYEDYFAGEMHKKRMKLWTPRQISKAFMAQYNVTRPTMSDEEYAELKRVKYTLPFKSDGDNRRLMFYKRFGTRFQPFDGYGNVYYTPDDVLPESSLPAPSYPWKWSTHLSAVRGIAVEIINTRTDDAANTIEEAGDNEGSENKLPTTIMPLTDDAANFFDEFKKANTEPTEEELEDAEDFKKYLPDFRRLEELDGTTHNMDENATSSGNDDEELVDMRTLQFAEYAATMLSQFHFSSGIPRFLMQSNESQRLFPSFITYQHNISKYLEGASKDFSQKSGDLTGYIDDSSQPTVDDDLLSARRLLGIGTGNDTTIDPAEDRELVEVDSSYKTDDTIYSALVDFYSYPAIDKELTVVTEEDTAGRPLDEAVLECTVLDPCRMQSGITVYTPLLSNLSVVSILANPNTPVALASPTGLRMLALRDMIATAFDAEREALRHGLQAPSTVWYSSHDQETDELADAILGWANMDNASEVLSAFTLFENFQSPPTSPIDFLPSYYHRAAQSCSYVMDTTRSVLKPLKFTDNEMVELMELIQSEFKLLNEAVEAYVRFRDANPQHESLVNATQNQEYYFGSEYTFLGFGFVMPETNDKNAVYRDMRLPVGFHLLLRLFIRFIESRLLLPEESRFMLACLSLDLNALTYYRCHPQKAPPAPILG